MISCYSLLVHGLQVIIQRYSRHKRNTVHRNRICKTDGLEPAWPVQDSMLQALVACTSTPTPTLFHHIRFQVFRLVNILLIYETLGRLNFSNVNNLQVCSSPIAKCDATRKKTLAGLVVRMRELRNLYTILAGKPRGFITGCQPCQIYKYTAG